MPFPVDDTNSFDEPGFLEYAWSDRLDASIPVDMHLAADSPNVDYATTAVDPDGSPADVGLFGGESSDEFDLDGDGYPAYYWPGTYYDAPAGVTRAAFDCEDLLPDYVDCL